MDSERETDTLNATPEETYVRSTNGKGGKKREKEEIVREGRSKRERTNLTQWKGMGGRLSQREDLSLGKKMREGKIEDENKRSLVRL